jgi:hypothetical protein
MEPCDVATPVYLPMSQPDYREPKCIIFSLHFATVSYMKVYVPMVLVRDPLKQENHFTGLSE